MFRILHLADLHLGWASRSLPGDRAAEQQRRRDDLLRRAVDFALRPASGIALVVIAGDLFETHDPPAPLAEGALAQLRRLAAGGITSVTVPGNHDEITYDDSIYRRRADAWPGTLVRNPTPAHVATITVGELPVHVYSLAYTGGLTPTRPPIADFPQPLAPPSEPLGFHLAVFHGTLGDWGGDRSLPLDAPALGRAGYDYIALGHIHQHREERLGTALAVYAGAVEGKGFDDPGVGFWTLVEVDASGLRVVRVPALAQPIACRRLDVSACESPRDLEAAIAALSDPELLLRVELTGALAFEPDVDTLSESLRDRFFHLEIADASLAIAPALLDAWAREQTILGQFVRRMRGQLDAAKDERERSVAARALRQGIYALRGVSGS